MRKTLGTIALGCLIPAITLASILMFSTSGQTWSPLSNASQCQYWFDGSDSSTMTPSSPTNGTAISQWNDKCTHHYNATQATGAQQPVYTTSVQNGKSAMLFVHKNMGFGGTTAMVNRSQPYSVYAVIEILAFSSSESIFHTLLDDTGSGNSVFFTYFTSSKLNFQAPGGVWASYTAALTMSLSQAYIVEFLYNGAGSNTLGNNTAYNGNTSLTIAAGSADNGANNVLGSYQVGGTSIAATINGYILEVFNLTTNNTRAQATSYLKSKWNL